MKRFKLWLGLKKGLKLAEKKGEKVFKKTEGMAAELEKMGRLGGQLFVARVG